MVACVSWLVGVGWWLMLRWWAMYARVIHRYVGAFLCGLGLTNQHTSILFEVPVVCWVAWYVPAVV